MSQGGEAHAQRYLLLEAHQPNPRMLAPRYARSLGIERDLMQGVVVPQWVRTEKYPGHLTNA